MDFNCDFNLLKTINRNLGYNRRLLKMFKHCTLIIHMMKFIVIDEGAIIVCYHKVTRAGMIIDFFLTSTDKANFI